MEGFNYTETTRNTAGQVVHTTCIDISGNTVKEVAGEASTHYTYDKSGNAYATYMTDAEGTKSMLTLSLCDAEGNNFAQISQPEVSDGSYIIGENSIVSYTDYDEKGNVIRETDGKGIVTTYAYDDENRLVSCNIDDTGDEDDITVSYASTNSEGLITTITDANGNMKTETQDWNGLITGIADINMHPEVTVDEDNETSSLLSTTVEYDTFGRKIRENFIDYGYILYTYDGSSANISKATSYRGSAETPESETTYTYDNADRMVSAVVTKDGSNVSTTSYTYDLEGKKLTETVSYGLGSEETIIYSYDAEGRLTETDYPDGSGLEDVTYTYDTRGNLLTVSHDGQPVCAYTYDGLGQLVSMKEYKNPETISSGYVLRTYTYDSYGQLTESIITDHKNSDAQSVTTYTYDKVGNRTAMTRDGQTTAYTYNGLNQLVEADTPDAIINYTYDGRGNQITEYNGTKETTTAYTYAVTGEMTGLSVSGGDVTTFTQENQYNHEAIRISKTEGGVTRRYYYDNGIVAYTKDGATVSSANVLSGDGDILGTYRGEDYHVYTKDVQNSAESIIKEDGSLAAAYCYSDFGETEELIGSSFDNEICYTGAVYDAESGLYYMNARYYDPANGRFISQDTYRGELDDADQWHLYAYCANNPINYVDPSGHAAFFGYWSETQHYFAYNQNAPQKYLGYYDVYDYAANYFGMDIGYFKKQTDSWKLELWKGKYGKMYGYGISSGCEIGLYYKSGRLWKCAYQKNRRLRMKMTLYKKGYSSKMFTRDSKTSTTQGKAWWLTAFQPSAYMPGRKAALPENLKMTGTIWFGSCDSKYHKSMRKLSNKFASGTTYSNEWGSFYVHESTTWKEKKFTWNYR